MAINPDNLAATAVKTFGEEFDSFRIWNGVSGLDTTGGPQWSGRVTASGTMPYNNELQFYVDPSAVPQGSQAALPNPFSVSDGVLAIAARPADALLHPSLQGQRYTSGLIDTFHAFNQTYGYFEMRAELPAGRGLWPAFWLLPQDGSWPPELDVMEMLGHEPGRLHTTVHSRISGAQQDGPGHFETTAATLVPDMTAGFHRFGVDWEPDAITWYFDGRQVFRAATPADMNKPMYMVANLAVGGDWPGAPESTTAFPAEMHIDYIRAYKALPPVQETVTFAFNFSDARIGSQGHCVTVDGPDGSHAVIAGTQHFVFKDGTIDQSDGSPLVDDLFYFAHNRDVWNAHVDPDQHYAQSGWREGRDPDAAFSTAGYLSANPDVAKAGMSPLDHYHRYGWKEGRDPSAAFDTRQYEARYADVADAHVDPLTHYLQYGIHEGRLAFADGHLG